MENYKGKDYLKNKLDKKRVRVNLRYKHYEMKNLVRDLNISTPPQLRNFMSVLGWNAKAVDSLADRIVFREFENDNFNLNDIFNLNNKDVLCDSAIVGALISSCDFIYIIPNGNDMPKLQVLDGSDATGVIDPTTNMLIEGYAVLERDKYNRTTLEAYFEKGKTTYYKVGEKPYSVSNVAPYPLLVPIIYRPDAKRPFGRARISRACMSIAGSAVRTMKRSEIAAEFFSFPQRYAVGMSEDAEPMEKWKAAMSSFIEITKDEEGDKPTVGQFQQQAMTPHTEQLKMFVSAFACETGLTMDDLGFATDNPSSAEAIKASHESLRLTARKAQRTFGTGFLNAGYLAACLRDGEAYKRSELYKTVPKWEPIFEPDASMLTALGDGLIKINQAVPGFLSAANLQDLTGIVPATQTDNNDLAKQMLDTIFGSEGENE